MIFRLRIHSRICVMLHRLPQQLLVRHAPVRVHACVRLCVQLTFFFVVESIPSQQGQGAIVKNFVEKKYR